ncbi:MAG: carboxy terminal-processing peptidase, partial [Oligoflexia bacterium]|nr:carboxy terminal-processing peptidase [Oligoflexia bacterium]
KLTGGVTGSSKEGEESKSPGKKTTDGSIVLEARPTGDTTASDRLRDQLLGNLVKHRLELMHFTQKQINDDLSEKAFDLFLERIDPGKQFLLQEDITALSKYKKLIDDEMSSGNFELVAASSVILKRRIDEVSTIVETLLKTPFDFNKKEFLESDAKKRKFAANKSELTDLWRKILKYNVLNSYLTTIEEEKEKEESLTAAAATATATATGGGKTPPAPKATPDKKLSQAEMEKKATEETLKNYRRLFSRMKQQDHNDELDLFFNAVAMVFDPHTNYMPPQKKEDFDIEMKGSLEGIGALLKEDGPYIKVVKIIPGSASAKAKLLGPEDTILKVGQGEDGEFVDVVNMRITDAVKLIRGTKGSKVRLTVKKPTGEVKIFSIVRDVVQIEESYAKGSLVEFQGSEKKFGYIYLPKFYRDFEAQAEGQIPRNCTDDVKAILEKFTKAKVSGVILDLRNNGGGALEDAKLLSGLFISKGPIVQVRQSNAGKDVLYDSDDGISYSGPLVVLINRFSASASEIVAGALQDYGRAVVIGGDHSHGKGTVQLFLNLDQGMDRIAKSLLPLGALKVTIQKFYRVNGSSTQYKGVIPDIILPDPLEGLDTSEKSLDYSLKWDEVRPLSFDKWKGDLKISKLVDQSKKRVQKSDKFQKLQKTISLLKKRREATLVSLNINDMRAEQEVFRAENKQYRVDQVNNKILVFKEQGGKFTKLDLPLINEESENQKKKGKNGKTPSLVFDGDDTGEDSENDWFDGLRKNPYVDEAMSVLMDMNNSTL